ncbi:hypothetical protein BH10BAC5_BH10BAC5_12160 [soil metagenome]
MSDQVNRNVGQEDRDNDHLESTILEYLGESSQSKPKLIDELITFYELSRIDKELFEIEEEKGDLPKIIPSLKAKLEDIATKNSDRDSVLTSLEKEKKTLTESNIKIEEKITKYDQEKFSVKSNKEYDAIMTSIDNSFDEIRKNEKRLKEIGKLIEDHNKNNEDVDAKLNILREELEEKQAMLKELEEEYKADEKEMKKKKKVLIDKLTTEHKSLYEKMNRMYHGEAVSIVRKGNCTGCYNAIPPQKVIEIRTAERIFVCESCGRILISEELLPAQENS